MFGYNDQRPITGTTSPIFVPREANPQPVRPGKDYFFMQFYSGQASFTGPIWQKAKQLIVSTQINMNHPAFGGDSLRAIQRARAVKKDSAEQLGLSPNLIKLVPATMPAVSVSIDFLLDIENRLGQMAGLINSDSFLSAISLAPGAALVARAVGGLSQKVLQTFIPAEEQRPILQFSGDFNLVSGGLQEGYYVILGSNDENNPLPDPLPKLEVKDAALLADGERITGLSYIVLLVRRTEARTRDLNDGAAWEPKLREAEDKAQFAAGDLATPEEKDAVWAECRKILRDAQALLAADPNYLRDEAEAIIGASLKTCADRVGKKTRMDAKPVWSPPIADIEGMGIRFENLPARLNAYAEQVAESREVLRHAGLV
ncbi:MAG: hypothetical protein M3N93_03065 [Acidobacteriota bacterium]|nr:hypothetical protein [Acidobacteriota bacterium]